MHNKSILTIDIDNFLYDDFKKSIKDLRKLEIMSDQYRQLSLHIELLKNKLKKPKIIPIMLKGCLNCQNHSLPFFIFFSCVSFV